jgi:4-diphosphocytidyl-2-C-methyl-D-erythritol kinase
MTPRSLRALAPAKINLGLFLGPLRADGRHELATVMQSISLADELTLRAASRGGERDQVLCPGVPDPPEDNLAARALAAFRAATGWDAQPLQLSIVKHVPVAAGLGGGSGDAAAALRLAARVAGIEDHELLVDLARDLGADVPAQVRPGRWLAGGAGELLRALPAPRAPLGVLVLPIARALSTAEVYAQADRMGLARGRSELEELHRSLARSLADGAPLPPEELLRNDLQSAARELCPEIDSGLAEALDAGADVALLSGSGPTVLGLFTGADGPQRAREATHALGGRVPGGRTPGGRRLGGRRPGGRRPGGRMRGGRTLEERTSGGRTPAAIAAEPVAAEFARAVGLPVDH